MKGLNLMITLIIAAAMLVSSFIISTSVKSLAMSIEKAGSSVNQGLHSQQTVNIPSSFRVDLGEVRLDNVGGSSGSFRIENTNK